MIAWPFITYSLGIAAFVGAHFLLAYRAWRLSRGEQSTDIDPDYVRSEDYFARSFRLKVSEWLTLPVETTMHDGTLTLRKGRELIRVSELAWFPQQSESDEILVVHGPFHSRSGCVFKREIYARGDAYVGPWTQLQAIAVDGNLVLGPGVRIARWADSLGDLEIGAYSQVRARATAKKSLCLHDGVQVGSAFASTVRTLCDNCVTPEKTLEPPAARIEIPGADAHQVPAAHLSHFGVESERLRMLSPDCWLYAGDLKPSSPLRITTRLIVKGDCILPPGTLLEADLKADGQIRIGEGSICKGNVIAGEDAWFGPSSRFYGVIHAQKTLRLSPGVCGGTEETPVAAFAEDTVFLAGNVLVHGKLASADRVLVGGSTAE